MPGGPTLFYLIFITFLDTKKLYTHPLKSGSLLSYKKKLFRGKNLTFLETVKLFYIPNKLGTICRLYIFYEQATKWNEKSLERKI